MRPPVPVPRPWIEFAMTMLSVDPELFDRLVYGQSPGPHIILGDE